MLVRAAVAVLVVGGIVGVVAVTNERSDAPSTNTAPDVATTMPSALVLPTFPEGKGIQLPRLVLGAAPSGGTIVVVCEEANGDGPLRTFVSRDGDATFIEAAQLPDGVTMTERSWVLVPDDSTILLGVALDTGELVVKRSYDGGRSWTLETSFADAQDFATVTVTPTGRIVVVAGIEASTRDDRGAWVPIGKTSGRRSDASFRADARNSRQLEPQPSRVLPKPSTR
ncbi:MAG: sialidase family protein [Ilumatobacteraceae bacterium]